MLFMSAKIGHRGYLPQGHAERSRRALAMVLFFVQAEDGIRYLIVTGVQTCALPILLIRDTKFRKTRLVPLHETAAAGLGRYLVCRHQVGSSDDHVFIGHRGQTL